MRANRGDGGILENIHLQHITKKRAGLLSCKLKLVILFLSLTDGGEKNGLKKHTLSSILHTRSERTASRGRTLILLSDTLKS